MSCRGSVPLGRSTVREPSSGWGKVSRQNRTVLCTLIVAWIADSIEAWCFPNHCVAAVQRASMSHLRTARTNAWYIMLDRGRPMDGPRRHQATGMERSSYGPSAILLTTRHRSYTASIPSHPSTARFVIVSLQSAQSNVLLRQKTA